jgi:indoleamine 2,3-dioxygenase
MMVSQKPSRFTSRGFLPSPDPAVRFERFPELAALDGLGRDLPSLLIDSTCRDFLRRQAIPPWPAATIDDETLPELRLYYLRLGFLAAGYINQVGQPREHVLPANLAVPLARACELLDRPPILSYDGYALYNWKRFDPDGPVALGNIDTIQNFVHLYDEHWFILVHVEIEATAAALLGAIERAVPALRGGDAAPLDGCLREIARAVRDMTGTLRRIPEHMDPSLYYRTFRPYIRFFERVVYEGVSAAPFDYRGETGAQSSIVPALVSFLKIEHQPTALTDHLRAPLAAAAGRSGGVQRRAGGGRRVSGGPSGLGAGVHRELGARPARHRRDSLRAVARSTDRRDTGACAAGGRIVNGRSADATIHPAASYRDPRSLGSAASRKASPTRLYQVIVRKIASPGK